MVRPMGVSMGRPMGRPMGRRMGRPMGRLAWVYKSTMGLQV